ncbi:YlxR family protein [Cellulomonas dongxiuzhuiae]|uniref:YlxR family protein n=1 Tax=Cellulomonas dongxiuzhuiae TaxID=2819979 RepID=A0ABX8GN23_9CELL|nr:YlxR family protein [Cellulomonas dongxiuzhuiae]MBO3096112.1 YlxR family protein [Cellulomonas dongxiuzhuiae]QWC17380.1 YlxR family protein [Cellulomonas dongxiuzhuiae]
MSRHGRLSEAGPAARLSSPSRRNPDPAPPVLEPGPVRTCVGCRATGLRSALLRVVLSDVGAGETALVVDERRRMPGRGAWLHPDQRCLELAVRRRAFGRALRHTGPLGTEVVERAVTRLAAQVQPQHSTTVPEPTPVPTVDREAGWKPMATR